MSSPVNKFFQNYTKDILEPSEELKKLRFGKKMEEPNSNQYLLRINIIKSGRLLCEYDILQKRRLNRIQALSKYIHKKNN